MVRDMAGRIIRVSHYTVRHTSWTGNQNHTAVLERQEHKRRKKCWFKGKNG